MRKAVLIMALVVMVLAEGCKKDNKSTGIINGHEWIDMALPSGTLWATCNIGATTPEASGDYFAWGETEPKDTCSWNTYKYANNGNYDEITKYCYKPCYGYNGFVDSLYFLQPIDDAATVNWGAGWRMPTGEELRELCANCIHKWTTQNGVVGHLFTALNGNTLFLPASGGQYGDVILYADSLGRYWSNVVSEGPHAIFLEFNSEDYITTYTNRSHGLSVRPVCSTSQE